MCCGRNLLFGCKILDRGGEELIISHIFYADDTLLFYEANVDQLKFFSWSLMWFEAMSGLRINLSKSDIIPIGSVDNVEELANELGCKVGSIFTLYLGLPLGAPHKAVGIWDAVEEGFQKRLASWKRQYISKGGKVNAYS